MTNPLISPVSYVIIRKIRNGKMTYEQFVELINMPSVLALIAIIGFTIGFGIAAIIDRLRS